MIKVIDIVAVVVVLVVVAAAAAAVGLLLFLHFISRMLLSHSPRFSTECKRQI